MKRKVIVSVVAIASIVALGFAAAPCQAQLLKKLEQGLLGGQNQMGGLGQMNGQGNISGQGNMNGQASLVGTVNLPPGQYMMSNVQTGQAFSVFVQNGQMYLNGQAQQGLAPGQSMIQQLPGMIPGMQQPNGMMPQQGGLKQGFGNFLKNELMQQQMQQQTQQPMQQQIPNQ